MQRRTEMRGRETEICREEHKCEVERQRYVEKNRNVR